MKERLKKLRRALNLTQQQFANRIGISRGNIATYETRDGSPGNSVINLICREFNVSEAWLRTGEGEMFVESSTFSLDEYAASHGCTDLDIDFLKAFFDLDPDMRNRALDYFQKSLAKRQQPPDTEDHIDAKAETWNGKTREQLHAELDQALDAEKERWTAEQAEAQSPSRDTMADAG